MKISKHAICFICTLIFITGCSKKINQEQDIMKEAENYNLTINKKISNNISVNIDKTFDNHDLKKYWIKADLYPVTQKWAQNIADLYYQPENITHVSEVEDYEEKYGIRLFTIEETKRCFSAQGNNIFIFNDRDFYDNCEAYYHEGNIYPFFLHDMESYYSKADLSFMSYSEADALGKSLLDMVGFTYNEDTCTGYSLTEDALMKYKNEHQERFASMKQLLEGMKERNPNGNTGDFIEDWSGTGGFYVFYYPIKINGLNIDEESTNTVMYAHVVINQNGIMRAHVPCQYRVVRSEEITVVKPEIALNKLIEMYENTILTGTVSINDVDLVFAQVAIEDLNKSEIDVQYVISPAWKFSVSILENDEVIKGNVLYAVDTGERIG